MPRIPALKPEQVPADSKPALDAVASNTGFTPNMMATTAKLLFVVDKEFLEGAARRIGAGKFRPSSQRWIRSSCLDTWLARRQLHVSLMPIVV